MSNSTFIEEERPKGFWQERYEELHEKYDRLLKTKDMEYIEVEKLIAEVKWLEEMDYPCDTPEQRVGFYDALDRIKSFIDSLQGKRSDVHLEKEEYVGVAETPSKTFQRVNEFEGGASYRH